MNIDFINKFKSKKIAVIGDLMLDRFLIGGASRLSPEAPVPVVCVRDEITVPGGAANVAVNIATLGGKAVLVGIVGRDPSSGHLLKLLKNKKIDINGVFRLPKRTTTEKTRIMVGDQQIARIDRETTENIDQNVEQKIFKYIKNNIKKWDGIVVSDYAKGLITKQLAKNIISLAEKSNLKVVVDTKPKNLRFFKNAFIVTPNQKEAFGMAGVSDIKKAARRISSLLKCNVLITQGGQGMTLCEGSSFYGIPAIQREVFDIIGAGDTVMATLVLGISSDASLKEASTVSNHSAGIAVSKFGTAFTTLKELKRDMGII